MHAEHADSDRLNDLSGRVIGCASTVLSTLGVGDYLAAPGDQTRGVHGL